MNIHVHRHGVKNIFLFILNVLRAATSMDDDYPPLKPEHTGLVGKCPRCGSGNLFSSFITIAKKCNVCGLDFDFADAGDGPAFFAICIAVVPVAGFAVWLEVSMGAPYWLNALLTGPFLIAACILPIRPLKGYLIAYQYVLRAKEGRLDHIDDALSLTAKKTCSLSIFDAKSLPDPLQLEQAYKL